jgi:hypothetical protein
VHALLSLRGWHCSYAGLPMELACADQEGFANRRRRPDCDHERNGCNGKKQITPCHVRMQPEPAEGLWDQTRCGGPARRGDSQSRNNCRSKTNCRTYCRRDKSVGGVDPVEAHAGQYKVTVKAPGFSTFSSIVDVHDGALLGLKVKLPVAVVNTVVDVGAEAVLVQGGTITITTQNPLAFPIINSGGQRSPMQR